MSPEAVARRLAAILSADAAGYSRLMADDEVATVRTVNAHLEEIARSVAACGGRVVDAPGDNLLAEVPSATDAVRCATEAQAALAARNAELPVERRMPFRIGVHLGEVMVEGERIYGDGVNVAARLESLAEPGGVCLSGKILEEVQGKLDIHFAGGREQKLKNVPAPVRVYRIEGLGAETRHSRWPRWQWWAAAAAAAVAVRLLFLLDLGDEAPAQAPAGPAVRSLAVLPLANLSGDASQDYFAAGMTDALIGDLAKSAALSVVSRTSVMQYDGVERPLREIADELGVDTVLEGSVLRAGESVRITAQLIDARTDRHLWSETYERDLRDVLDLQRDVAKAIAGEIQLELAPAPEARPVNPEAYEAYLQGRHFIYLQGALNHVRGIKMLERAVALDPGYAPAWAHLAIGYT